MIVVSALILLASFVVLLALAGLYLGKPAGPLLTLVLGVLWFSLADWDSAL